MGETLRIIEVNGRDDQYEESSEWFIKYLLRMRIHEKDKESLL